MSQINKPTSGAEEKIEIDQPAATEVKEEKAVAEPKDEQNNEISEAKEPEKLATSSAASSATTVLTTTKIDLIKDIESHIEIIYECLDELNETVNATGSSSSQNKTALIEIPASLELSSQEAEKTVKETTEIDGETSNDHAAQNESKNE